MKVLGVGYEIWHVEGIKRVWVWDMCNTNLDHQGIGKETLIFFRTGRCDGFLKCFTDNFCNKMGEII